MSAKPSIVPLDIDGTIYALHDAQGNIIGTGTREVCEVLMYIITRASTGTNSPEPDASRTDWPCT